MTLVGTVTARSRLAVVLVPLSLVVLIAGPNLPYPLMPRYARELDLDATRVSVLFSAYLAVLIIVLLIMTRPGLQTRPRAVLLAALVCSILADPLVAIGTESALLTGRVLSGISVGLGTGSASVLAFRLSGERGRTVAATGTAGGAVLGMALSAGVAELGPVWSVTGYLLHGAIAVLTTGALATALVRVGAAPVTSTPASLVTARRAPLGAYALGALGWTVAAVVVALVPTLSAPFIGSESFLLPSIAPIVFLACAYLGQLLVRFVPDRAALVAAIAQLAFGIVGISAAIAVGSLPALLAACAVAGAGQGASYRLGLGMVTAGLESSRQGARASAYSCQAYAVSAAVVVATGATVAGLGSALGLFAVSAALLPALALTATSLRERRSAPTVSAAIDG